MTFELTSGSVSTHLRQQATPMVFGLIAILSFEVVDLFFVSQLGDAPLAAISFTFPVIWLIDSMAIGFESGAASCVSRAIGSGGDVQLCQRLGDGLGVEHVIDRDERAVIGQRIGQRVALVFDDDRSAGLATGRSLV